MLRQQFSPAKPTGFQLPSSWQLLSLLSFAHRCRDAPWKAGGCWEEHGVWCLLHCPPLRVPKRLLATLHHLAAPAPPCPGQALTARLISPSKETSYFSNSAIGNLFPFPFSTSRPNYFQWLQFCPTWNTFGHIFLAMHRLDLHDSNLVFWRFWHKYLSWLSKPSPVLEALC